MAWLLGFIGAFLGLAVAEISDKFWGFVGGALIGALIGALATLRGRVAKLEQDAAERAVSLQQARASAWDEGFKAAGGARAEAPRAPVVATGERVGPARIETPAPAPVPEPSPEPIPQPRPQPVPAAESAPPADAPWPTEAPIPAMASAAARPDAARPDAETRERIAGAAARVAAGQGAFDRTPREPSWEERGTSAIKRWFTEGNVPVKIGMLVLFVGVAALLKYAVDNGLLEIPVELWFALAGGLGLASLVFGWRQREERRVFGLALQGGGIGILLLTVFAAYKLYQLLPAGVAFGLVVLLVGGSALLAVLQNALWLAVLGFLGGYLAPVLISTGSGNHVALFTYYAILNAAVFGVAWVRPWRALNLIGFFFTFVVGLAWGERYYEPAKFATVEPFLILFTLFYIGIGVLYALRQPEAQHRTKAGGLVDGTLVFGTPLLAFPLQAALLRDDDMALALSALGLAGVYALLATWLSRREGMRVLMESYLALAIGFVTLAVPLAFSAQWTATTWALEGAALVWLGLRQERWLPRFTGVALQGAAAIAWCVALVDDGWRVLPDAPWILNGRTLGALLIALAAWTTSYLYERHRPGRYFVVVFAFLWATAWWTWAGIGEIDTHVESPHELTAMVAFTLITMLLAVLLRGAWARLGWLAVGGFAVAIPLAFGSNAANDGVFEKYGAYAWVPFLLLGPWLLHRLREPHQRALSLAHVLYLGLWPLLVGLQLVDVTSNETEVADGWRYALPWLPFLVMTIATWRVPKLATAPLADLFPHYRLRWFGPVALLLLVAWVNGLGQAGNAWPLPFVPLLNPVELTQIVILLLVWLLCRDGVLAPRDAIDVPRNAVLLGAFVTLTFATLRAVHHFEGVAWSPAILDNKVAQTALTVVWSIVGVSAWIAGSKRLSRPVWLAGAILMGVVLAKLVLIDRTYTGDIPGIVSFIAVGLLMVMVGYFAPSPPRSAAPAAAAHDRDAEPTAPEKA